jgi:branched-chain amino acid transport system substrate-binding protein
MSIRARVGRGISGAAAAVFMASALTVTVATSVDTPSANAAEAQFVPVLVYRTGPYAPNGIPWADGFVDYYKLINKRDGGINGVKLLWEECEFRYDTKAGLECYERLKNRHGGATLINPYSTGVTYQLIPKARVDEIPVHSMGYGRTAASDGRVFPWVFTFPTSYWSQASAFIKYVGAEEGGMDALTGKKIALVYHNSPYGKEPIPTLEALAERYGYTLTLLPVDHPGQEQKSTWLQVRRLKPDWTFLWGWGVMNQVAIKEAAAIRYPMERLIGGWWSGSESDVVPAGDGATGYKSSAFHAPGARFPAHDEILSHVYGGDRAAAAEKKFGDVLYNRGILNAVLNIEAIRTAMTKFGNRPMTGAELRWGLENLDLTEQRLGELGLAGFTKPIKITCEDHEGNGPIVIQQWNGEAWTVVSEWITPMRDIVRPMIEQAATQYAAENGIEPRDCAAER